MSDLPLGPLHKSEIASLREENSDLKRMLAGTQYRAEALEKENERLKRDIHGQKLINQGWHDDMVPLAEAIMGIDRETTGCPRCMIILDAWNGDYEPKTVADKGRDEG